MKVVTYSHLRANLAKIMDQAADDHDPVIVTRTNGKTAVLISLEDFGSYEETRYLNASPANAKRLNEAIAQADRGEGLVSFQDMEELEAFVAKAAKPRQDAAE